jgi:hypothetical protein
VCFVSRPNQVRPYKDAAVDGLHLADDDEVGVQRVADEREVAERARRPEYRGIADDSELRIRGEREDGRVGEPLRQPAHFGLAGLVVEEDDGDARLGSAGAESIRADGDHGGDHRRYGDPQPGNPNGLHDGYRRRESRRCG